MKKILFLTSLMTLLWTSAMGQKFTIKGSVIDKETSEALLGANVQVLSLPDSVMVVGAIADDMGAFTLRDVKKANYALKISFMGYETKVLPLKLNERKNHQVDLGYLTLSTDSKMLKEAVVTTTVAKVQVSGDSIQYNPQAYRVPQGSTLEALVKLLPGAEVDDDGNITINGKSVSKILVDGKEFFLNDKSIAMKNIPVDVIEKIKTYERKSDMARITGVDDGEEETVLDLSVKKGMKNGWFGNALAGMGTEHRYMAKALANYYNENTTVTALGNGRNVPENPRWNRGGLSSYKEGGMNFASKNTTMETGGSVSYRYNGSDNASQSNSESFNTRVGKKSQNGSQNFGSRHQLEAQFKMEWHPDTMTTILFRPNFNYTQDNGMGHRDGMTFGVDVANVTDSNELAALAKYGINVPNLTEAEILAFADSVVTRERNQSQSHSNSTNTSGELQITRRLGKPGRNVTLRVSGNYSQSETQNLSASYTNFYLKDSIARNNRYYDTPAHNYGLSGQLVWSEPIADRLYLNMSYRFSYDYRKSDNQAFVYDSEVLETLADNLRMCRYDIDEVLRLMREANFLLRDTLALSQFSEYRNYNQRIGLQIRQVREKYNFSAGIDAFPQHSKLDYRYMGHEYPEVSRTVFNVTPRVNLRVNFNKTTNMQLRYNGRTSQPSMTNLLDIVDDSNPRTIRRGNPGLKPSFTHNWNGNFNTFNPENQRGLWSWLYGSMTRNSIGNKTSTGMGVQTIIPTNINGNWNIGGGVGLNTALGKGKKFSVGGNVGGSFRQSVSLFNNTTVDDSYRKSITQETHINTGANAQYRNDWVSIELRGWLNETHAENNVNSSGNRDTQDFNYGSDIKFTAPWGTELASDIYMNSRRGYSQKNMNTDELLWNASIAHSFLKGNALTIKGEVYDILGQRSNVSRSVSSEYISDSRNNGIYQYGLVSLIYRFSVFAGKNTMGTKDERREDERRRGW